MTTTTPSATPSATPAPLAPVQFSWKWLVAQGVLGVLFGLAALVFPIAALASFALLWGVWALLDGVTSLTQAFAKGQSVGTRVLLGVLALVSLFAALFAILRPFTTVGALTWFLGIWLVVRGAGELVAVFGKHPAKVRLLIGLSAVLDIALGILFFLNPGRGAMSLTVVLGILALVWGVSTIVAGIVFRSQKGELATPVEAAGDVDGAVRTPVDPTA